MLSNILLATDGSPHSHLAADKAIEIAALTSSVCVDILYVVDENRSKSDVLQHGDSKTTLEKRETMLGVFKEKFKKAGIFSKITILHEPPAETIIKYANNNNFDCLIIGSRGRSRVQTMVLGSVSHKVMKYVKAPILLVK